MLSPSARCHGSATVTIDQFEGERDGPEEKNMGERRHQLEFETGIAFPDVSTDTAADVIVRFGNTHGCHNQDQGQDDYACHRCHSFYSPPRLLSPAPGFISRMRRARTPDGKNDERPEMKRMAVNSLFDSVFDISFRKFNIRIGQQS